MSSNSFCLARDNAQIYTKYSYPEVSEYFSDNPQNEQKKFRNVQIKADFWSVVECIIPSGKYDPHQHG